jgi:hypothetical protein
MAILCAVMAATNGFLALVSILFYLDFRSRDRSRAGWENSVLLTLDEHTHQIAALTTTVSRQAPTPGLVASLTPPVEPVPVTRSARDRPLRPLPAERASGHRGAGGEQ